MIDSKAVNLQITGGQPLSGRITTNTSKNSAVALLAASLINRGTTVLKSVPKIEEVYRLLEVLTSLGVQATWQGSALTIRPPATLALNKLDREAAIKTRSIILWLGALVHHYPNFKLPHPGGCHLATLLLITASIIHPITSQTTPITPHPPLPKTIRHIPDSINPKQKSWPNFSK
jgi:UDP-N-acetylglucosamine 1-carboxyvinyltransferase